MDQDLARIVATAGTGASRQLGDLVALLAKHLPEDEELRLGVATAIAEIGLNVIRPAFDAHPELEAEFQRRVDRYERST